MKNICLKREGRNNGTGNPCVWDVDVYALELSRGMHVLSRMYTTLLRTQSVLVQRVWDRKVIGENLQVVD